MYIWAGRVTDVYLLHESCHIETGERRLFRWFEDHSVATCQCRGQLPRSHHQGEVPLQDKNMYTCTGKSWHWHTGWSQVKSNNSSLAGGSLSFSLCLNIFKWENVLGPCTVFLFPQHPEKVGKLRHMCNRPISLYNTQTPVFSALQEPLGLSREPHTFSTLTQSIVSFSLIFSSFLLIVLLSNPPC